MKTKEQHNIYQKNWYNKRRKQFFDILGNCCSNCGSIEQLEIDHVDPQQKSFNIGKKYSYSIGLVIEELSKCQLLCHTCHIIKHKPKCGTYTSYRHNKCRCSLCKKS